ncbi:MAG TPA: inositol monophosphatase family protein [Hyphomonadaceae bacterium]|nr:inositol monophosphatase family protein [Hyphomonadaceae bacterium]
MSRPSPTVTVMMDAARAAGRRLIRDFGEVENLQVSRKGPSDFVSTADKKAEEILRDRLEKARPGYGFLLEEGGSVTGTDKTHRFIVDPLDGTLNFLHGIPHFAVSVGLEREGKLRAGVVFDPMRNEMFWAEEGVGAWLENKRLRVASRKKLSEAVVTTGIPQLGVDGFEKFATELAAVRSEVAAVRRFGSAALDLAWVAAGRFDGFWERGLSLWDIAAGFVLVQEAGGMIIGLNKQDASKGSFVASNTSLAQKLAERIEGKIPRSAGPTGTTGRRLLR